MVIIHDAHRPCGLLTSVPVTRYINIMLLIIGAHNMTLDLRSVLHNARLMYTTYVQHAHNQHTPGSPMQVDPANVPLPPTTERTPDDQLWLPSDATTLYQLPLVIHIQPPGQQYHSQALKGEPISPERSALRQSLSAMFNVPVPPHAYTRPTSPMDTISESQSRCNESRRSPSEPSIPST